MRLIGLLLAIIVSLLWYYPVVKAQGENRVLAKKDRSYPDGRTGQPHVQSRKGGSLALGSRRGPDTGLDRIWNLVLHPDCPQDEVDRP